jgi:hypothetical protein
VYTSIPIFKNVPVVRQDFLLIILYSPSFFFPFCPSSTYIYISLVQRKSHLHHFTIGFQKPGICSDSWFLESNGKMVKLGFSLIKNQAPHGLGFCAHRAILFTPGHAHQLTSSGWLRWDDCSLIEPCLFGDTGIELELNPWSSIFDQRKSQLHHFTIGFQKPGFCADSWFLKSNGKMVQLGFSLIILFVHTQRLKVETGGSKTTRIHWVPRVNIR